MSTHANAFPRSIAGLLGCLVATGAWAQQAEMEVSKVDTEVDVVTAPRSASSTRAPVWKGRW
jgi:hypothetical protein